MSLIQRVETECYSIIVVIVAQFLLKGNAWWCCGRVRTWKVQRMNTKHGQFDLNFKCTSERPFDL